MWGAGIDNSDGDKFKISGGYMGTDDRLIIDTAGNVGIGVSPTGGKLRVEGSIYIPVATASASNGIRANTSTFTYNSRLLNTYGLGNHYTTEYNNYGTYMSAWYGIDFFTGGTRRLHIKREGIGGTTSGSYLRIYNSRLYYYSSSSRFKENIQTLEGEDYYKIFQARPTIFTDKETKERNIGYIAEEFDELGLNHLVIYNEDGQPDGLKYELISLYLVEIMKDQQQRIQELDQRLQVHEKSEFRLIDTSAGQQISKTTETKGNNFSLMVWFKQVIQKLLAYIGGQGFVAYK